MWREECCSRISDFPHINALYNPDATKLAQKLIEIKHEDNQTILENTADYYIAHNAINDMIYINMKNVLMLDIDSNNPEFLDKIKDSTETFDVYKSGSGYHAFCISKTFDYKDINSYANIVELYSSDCLYVLFSYVKGWCVRLNLKHNETRENVYEYIGRFGQANPTNTNINNYCLNLVNLHIEKTKEYITSPKMKQRDNKYTTSYAYSYI